MIEPEFQCVTLAPADLGAEIAIATARAGGVGLIDLEFSRSPGASEAVRRLLTSTEGGVGVRIGAVDPRDCADILAMFAARAHWLVLSADGAVEPGERISRLPKSPGRKVFIEVTDVSELAAYDCAGVTGVVVRGHEAGGRVGEDTSLILLQKLLRRTGLPIYVLGGVGPFGAAACRVAGAAGVVLFEQLLLMPESPLAARDRQHLSRLNGQEARAIGERLGKPLRVLVRPGFAGAERLTEAADRLESEGSAASGRWRAAANDIVGWGSPDAFAWPVGHAIGLAADFRDRYRTTGRAVQAMLRESQRWMETARLRQPLAPGSLLAKSHATRYPIVQGPMTRVSDSSRFAAAVAHAGALPFLALALMRGEQTLNLLRETAAALGGQPWGVGLLGFVPKQLRDEQIQAIWKVKPDFALIAGGRPDQAAEFERRGIATYIHVPTPELLRMFLEQGARRFVFEGRECGGHIGPLSSFTLWESQIRVLVDVVPRADRGKIHVLFAGGISDAVSAAMVGVMAAPLADLGMNVGVLMGSAYLFTREIVETGAIVPEFQAQAVACRRTVNLETGPGHATRCADTPFAREFEAERTRLLSANESADIVRARLEELNLGRLRIASKGLRRSGSSGVEGVDPSTQVREGMYMIGQVATLYDRTTTLEELHRDVSARSAELIDARGGVGERKPSARRRSDVAVIGIGLLLPGAGNPSDFWHNVLHRVSGIREIPRERWDWRLYYAADRTARDKVYSKWGGFIDEIPFDPLRYGIPPASLKSIDPLQLLTLEVIRLALEDAGYGDGGFDRENTSVILGAGGGLGDLGMQYGVRSEIPRFVESPAGKVWDRLPEWTEESFAGSLLNVAAGRAANRFDFGGLNFTVDAACASALAAINLAVSELDSGRSSMVVAGGVDTIQSPFGYLCFSKTQALSPQGRARTFDTAGDGIVISEGFAIVVLKRLADAERDGDRIYAVVKSVAGSSDGKAMGLTAPLPAGQKRALRRAYERAGISPATVGLLEAHGTGTAVGDRAETETIVETLREAGASRRACAIGSVKSLIGHTKAAAGAVGLAKTALALHHRVLPPHEGVEHPLESISADDSPVYLLREPRPWFANPDHPRRAAVSAFGFGGTNFHAVLEEYTGEFRHRARSSGADAWPCELFVFRGADDGALESELHAVEKALGAGARPRLRDLAYAALKRAESARGPIAAIVASTHESLREDIERARNHLRGSPEPLPSRVQVERHVPQNPGRIALLFPGQGSQYPDMAREAALYLDPLRCALEQADAAFGRLAEPLTSYIFPPGAYTESELENQRRRLTDTRVAQPAIGAISAGFLDLLTQLGLDADMVAGHSYGEFTALHAAGSLSRQDFFALSAARGRAMADAADASGAGAMAAVQATRGEVEDVLRNVKGVAIANHNAPSQVVISGGAEAVRAAAEQLQTKLGAGVRMLPVSAAFHSAAMAAAIGPLKEAIQSMHFCAPGKPTYSNVTAAPYPDDPGEIRKQLVEHGLKAVEFSSQIERMYQDGARIFVETGPRAVLTGLVDQILSDREHVAVALDAGGLRGALSALGLLLTKGVSLSLSILYEMRNAEDVDVTSLQGQAQSSAAASWFLSGGCIRSRDDLHRTGRLPALDLDGVEAGARQMSSPPAPQAQPFPMRLNIEAHNGSSNSTARALDALRGYQETMRQFLETQDRIMAAFLGGTQDLSDDAAAVAESRSAAEPVPAAPPVNVLHAPPPAPPPTSTAEVGEETHAPGRDELRSALLKLVSERTGYPPEMLGFDQDIESELGIDSIKRVEVLGALMAQFPASLAGTDMEALTRIKTLNGILDRLHDPAPARAGAEIAAPRPEPAVEPAPSDRIHTEPIPISVPRFTIRGVSSPLNHAGRTGPVGAFLLTEDERGVAQLLAAMLEARGASARILESDMMERGDALEAGVRDFSRERGLDGVIHLAPLTVDDGMPEGIAEWRSRCARSVKGLFRILRAGIADFADPSRGGGHLITASSLGGAFGRTAGGCTSPWAGGAVGLVKTAALEYPGLNAKALDFESAASPADIAECLLSELAAPGGPIEVGFPGGHRTVFVTAELPYVDAPEAPCTPSSGWVVLATGGGRGVTAELACELAVKGVRIVLAGRTALPREESAETAGIDDPEELRRACVENLRTSATEVTPVLAEREVKRVLAEREIRRNISRLRGLGAEVEYRSVDVRRESEFGRLIDDIYRRHGRLDAVLHGAGVIEDKLLIDKSPESFDRVFDTKADSGFILARRLRAEGLRLFVLCASVAGRYGNRGQADYAAGNEVLNRLAWTLHGRFPECRVLAVNWGPWNTVGMATGAVRKQFRERGIVPIEAVAGRRFLRDELRFGNMCDVEVVAGEGPWSDEPEAKAEPAAQPSPMDAPPLPFVASAPAIAAGGAVTLEHVFDLARDPYLGDHRLDNVPVLAAAAAAEWLAEFVQASWPDRVVEEIRDLRVLRGLRLESDASRRAVLRAASSSHADAAALKVSAELADAAGNAYYRCTVLLGDSLPESPAAALPSGLQSGCALEAEAAYREFLFHGPRFRTITAVNKLSAAGAEAVVSPSDPTAWTSPAAAQGAVSRHAGIWLFDPGLLDAAPQLAIIWSRQWHGSTPLPSRLGRIVRYGSQPMPESLLLLLRIRENSTEHRLTYDASFVDAGGKVRLYMGDIESTGTRALNRLSVRT